MNVSKRIFGIICCFTLVGTPFSKIECASVGSPAYVRVAATIYEKASTFSRSIGVVPKGKVLRVTAKQGSFYRFKFGDTYGYTLKSNLLLGDSFLSVMQQYPELFTSKATVHTGGAIYLEKSTKSKKLFQAKIGESFIVVSSLGDWLKVTWDGLNGYIKKNEVSLTRIIPITNYETKKLTGSKRQNIVDYAQKFVGNPYVWGGESLTSGADCSGFVRSVLKEFGLNLKRCSYEQAEQGKPVKLSDLQPGDLIFYYRGNKIGHVSMYIGNGKAVHARGAAYGIVITDYDYNTPAWARNVID